MDIHNLTIDFFPKEFYCLILGLLFLMKKKLVIVQPYVPTYRVAFFERLARFLSINDIHMMIASGTPAKDVLHRGDSAYMEQVVLYNEKIIDVRGRKVRLGGSRKIWRSADAVIVPDYGSSVDTNLACLRVFGPKTVGIWGHIKSYVNEPNSIDKAIERWQLRSASHVFAYVESGASEARAAGVTPERITAVMNTIDVDELLAAVDSEKDGSYPSLQSEYELDVNRTFGFIGGLDSIKRIDFLAAVLDRIWEANRSIRFLVCGRGADEHLLRKAENRGQVIMLGYADSKLKARLGSAVRALVMPGAIGLIAVDALVLGRPIITSDISRHGPESEYLIEGVSKHTSGNSVEEFSQLIIKQTELPAERYYWEFPKLQDMVTNFGSGILKMMNVDLDPK